MTTDPTQILTVETESVQHIAAVITSLDLTVLILAVFGAVFVTPPVDPLSGLYKSTPKTGTQQVIKRERSVWDWFYRMPRAAVVFSWFLFTNICLALSMIFYLYDSRNPMGQVNGNWYVSIESLFFFLCILKYLWLGIVWNMHRYMFPMIMAIIKAIIMPIIIVILIILLGVRHSWPAMALMFPVFLFYIALPLWSVLIFCRYRKSQVARNTQIEVHVHHERRY